MSPMPRPSWARYRRMPASVRRDLFDGAAQLLPAIAFERTQQIAREAFRVEPRQHRAGRGRVVYRDREMLGPPVPRAKGVDPRPLGPFERHPRRRDPLEPVRGGDVVGHDPGRSHPKHIRLFGPKRGGDVVDLDGDRRRQETRDLGKPDRRQHAGRHRLSPRLEGAAQRLGEVGRRVGEACQRLDRQPPGDRDPDHVRRIEADFQGGGPVMGNREVRFPPPPDGAAHRAGTRRRARPRRRRCRRRPRARRESRASRGEDRPPRGRPRRYRRSRIPAWPRAAPVRRTSNPCP